MEKRVCLKDACARVLGPQNLHGYCKSHKHLSDVVRERDRARNTPERIAKVAARVAEQRITPEGKEDERRWAANKRAKPGHAERQAESTYKCRYGVSREEATALLAFQNGTCALCPKQLTELGKGKLQGRLDHCHLSGGVRGILCARCNVLLGGYEAIKDKAPDYLHNPPFSKLVKEKTLDSEPSRV